MRTLVLAEKPSVARDIARVLGAAGRGEGCLMSDRYVVTWAIGHLVSLCEPDEIEERYKKWRAEDLPILPDRIPTKVLPKTRSQFAVVRKWLRDPQIDRVVCATDSGREGELIFRYIYDQAGCSKPVDRLWISSMTDAAIREGFSKLKSDSEYDPLYFSARSRSAADWLVGMNASRAFSIRYRARLPIGRVQTPTLRLIVDRDREIENFQSVDYWEIRADFGDYTGLWQNPERRDSRCPDEETAKRVRRETQGREGRVKAVTREQKKTPPPQLYDLTSLQRDANRALGFSATKTLDIVQALYESHKMVTYPRTDSRYLTHDMAPGMEKVLSTLPAPWKELAEGRLPKPAAWGRVFNDAKVSDHHAIVPTGQYGALNRLKPEERAVYDRIVRRVVAAWMGDYRYESTQVETQVGGHLFRTSGVTPLSLGWRAAYPEMQKEEAQTTPPLREGDVRTAEKVSIKKEKTRPPAPHTDASLLYLMEHAGQAVEDEALRESMKDNGLGTPATRAATIERLLEAKYITRRGKTLRASDKGRTLIDIVPPEMSSPEMTGKWERALSGMAREKDPQALATRETRFLESIRRYTAFLVEAAAKATAEASFEPEPYAGRKGRSPVRSLKIPCPLCGEGQITANSRAFGCSRWRDGCRFTVWRDCLARQGGPEITEAMMKKLLAGEAVSDEKGRIEWRGTAPAFTPVDPLKAPPRRALTPAEALEKATAPKPAAGRSKKPRAATGGARAGRSAPRRQAAPPPPEVPPPEAPPW